MGYQEALDILEEMDWPGDPGWVSWSPRESEALRTVARVRAERMAELIERVTREGDRGG